MPMSPEPRKKIYTKRSRTGCRTCRARRIKCDESPNACNNCTRTGRKCEGYELYRVPRDSGKSDPNSPRNASVTQICRAVTSKLQWKVTSDEGRCLAFFEHQSVPQLVTFFDSPLWQQLVLELCYCEPAVFHGVVALGAVNQAYEIAARGPPGGSRRLLLGRKGTQNKWYQFAIEQAGRAFAMLNKRRASNDPTLHTVILVCCLLFVMCELLHRKLGTAIVHMESGLRILRGMRVQRQAMGLVLTSPSAIERCVGETFLSLQGASAFFGIKDPLDVDTRYVFEQPYNHYLESFTSLQHARQVLKPLLNTASIFVAQCMHASEAEMKLIYPTLQCRQFLLVGYFTRFLKLFADFCDRTYGTSSFTTPTTSDDPTQRKAYREAEITRLSALYSLLAAKLFLYDKTRPVPDSLTPECEAVIVAAETAMDKLPSQSPTITVHHEIVPALNVATIRCPDYRIRCRGIAMMRSWGAIEGFMSASLNADLMEESMKQELLYWYRSAEGGNPPGVTFEMNPDGRVTARIEYRLRKAERDCRLVLERNEDLVAQLLDIENAENWPCVRSLGLLDHVKR
ncbi:hypothetical protein BO70DRAFT_209935 [Aspergillus heteromorphus CBS 117.55]|uniref:Zn(2)-C6 fungal-type domain-containing protein n=1 Tax=Aspergillus heteromorphus CBS 117.55 TaxID=1448321 RepID=A0A317WM08_9EURO|nr:uncharacterized protein BO70DRAFT_209935 [Aspergillus heteromorphus CBS 117.55]PWY86721.1 hypothetical protein BO70DRAFT_209935 [Aspergillus heteromorphus CBS 117.55]